MSLHNNVVVCLIDSRCMGVVVTPAVLSCPAGDGESTCISAGVILIDFNTIPSGNSPTRTMLSGVAVYSTGTVRTFSIISMPAICSVDQKKQQRLDSQSIEG